MASINHDLYLHVLTPVHVGGSDDKHLVEGLDYLIEKGLVYIFDQKKLRKEIGNDSQYINALEEGKAGILNLLNTRRISLADVSHSPKQITGTASEIKACIKNGMNGKPYLPGSSIKGALRSAIFSYVYKRLPQHLKNRIRNDRNPDNSLLGSFQDSLMRFIQVSDVYFDEIETILCNAKVFNLHKSNKYWEGGWKHQLDNHTTENFSPEGFTFAYESIPPYCVGNFRLSYNESLFREAINNTELNIKSNVRNLFADGFKETLFNIILASSESYLNKEIAFFDNYSLEQTVSIISSLRGIENKNKSEAPVLRMASGSGFHSITGDWQYESSHIISKVWGNPFDKMRDGKTPNPDFDKDYQKYGIPFGRRRKLEGGLMWKSRRLCFDEAGEEFSFTPMGFVQLCTPEYYEQHIKAKVIAALAAAEAEALEVEKLRKEQEEAARLAAEEAKKPIWRTLAEVMKDGILDGEVVRQNGFQVLVKPFVKGYENQELPIRYPAGFSIGTVVEVKARVQKKQIQLTFPIKEK
jgi:CRISPR/Cas system CSM-associated protein Csm5 (group 7 of RAMP superfamily)